MLHCSRFLQGYSDYRDGLLDARETARFRSHLELCPSCARYDRVLNGGVKVLERQGAIEPSDDFALRLRYRLLEMERASARESGGSGTGRTVAVGVALALAVAAWAPTLRRNALPTLPKAPVAHVPRNLQVVPPPFEVQPLLASRSLVAYHFVRQ